MGTKIVILAGSLMLTVGGWMAALGSWADLLQPGTIAALLSTVGGVVMAWLGQSPIRPKA